MPQQVIVRADGSVAVVEVGPPGPPGPQGVGGNEVAAVMTLFDAQILTELTPEDMETLLAMPSPVPLGQLTAVVGFGDPHDGIWAGTAVDPVFEDPETWGVQVRLGDLPTKMIFSYQKLVDLMSAGEAGPWVSFASLTSVPGEWQLPALMSASADFNIADGSLAILDPTDLQTKLFNAVDAAIGPLDPGPVFDEVTNWSEAVADYLGPLLVEPSTHRLAINNADDAILNAFVRMFLMEQSITGSMNEAIETFGSVPSAWIADLVGEIQGYMQQGHVVLDFNRVEIDGVASSTILIGTLPDVGIIEGVPEDAPWRPGETLWFPVTTIQDAVLESAFICIESDGEVYLHGEGIVGWTVTDPIMIYGGDIRYRTSR